ncbi:sperm flagellar protein 1 [Austrofundulus limnaeus]|uniref:Sperm flagellar protein 1 n=1 Tax=Austrofundulus limnaeus TaxID=52670 RepID=A0A2I4CZP9_AUSLI|nr:PREDICTED: sperm flagellar protein 1-like [Austrofundulus limnaeus]
MDRKLEDYEIENLLSWLDKIPFSRPKRKLRRDFSDGVLVAEVIKHFFPKFVDLSSLTVPFSSREEKLRNWSLLNRKVFPKLDFYVPEEVISEVVLSSPGAIEPVLSTLREKIDRKLADIASKKPILDNVDIKTLEKTPEAIHEVEARILAQLAKMKIDEENIQKTMKQKVVVESCYTVREPTLLRQFIFEKDQVILDLQEVVKILQTKVEKLEHLLELKDIRIDQLTKINASNGFNLTL